ncbi:MerR family transcriptional regulator [Actinoallomurus sp. CA-150999]|uniref:helix-turn-helix domain-containing protein n=1 Tax=Actinoallomurus sp. CA-150999 TaxID=3239887 RepID=UPI003D8FE71C
MDGPWTLAELTAKAASVLSDGRSAPPSGRVRDLPGERTIRWYVTIGLVDPPLSRRGRIAVYGPRHLLQLVAIKRRQAEGRALADIQAELTGATDATLRRIARLDTVDVTAEGPAETAAAPTPLPTRDSPPPGERPSAPDVPAPGETAPESPADAAGSAGVTGGSRPESLAGEPAPESAADAAGLEQVTGGNRPPDSLGGGPAPERVARRFWAERPASPAGRGTAPPEGEPAPRAPRADAAPDGRGTADAAGAQDVAESIGAADEQGAIRALDAGGAAAAHTGTGADGMPGTAGARDVAANSADDAFGAISAPDAGRTAAAAGAYGAIGAGDAGHAVAAAGAADAAGASAADHAVSATGTGDPGSTVATAPDAADTSGAGALVRGVRLAPGVTLLLDSSPSPDDATAIVAAAAPLLDLLSERGLL